MDELSCAVDAQIARDLLGASTTTPGDIPPDGVLTQHVDVEDHNVRLETTQNHENAAGPQMSVREIFKKYIPEHSPWMRSINARKTKCWSMDDKARTDDNQRAGDLLNLLRYNSRNETPCVFIIQEIDLDWCETLSRRFPGLDQNLLAQHMLRFDEREIVDGETWDENITQLRRGLKELCPESDLWGYELSSHRMISLRIPGNAERNDCFHIDSSFDLTSETGTSFGMVTHHGFFEHWSDQFRYRPERFQKDSNGQWRKTSSRISFCSLEDTLREYIDPCTWQHLLTQLAIDLALIDAPLRFEAIPFDPLGWSFYKPQTRWWHTNFAMKASYRYLHGELRQNPWPGERIVSSLESVLVLFKFHTVQSVFDPNAAPLRLIGELFLDPEWQPSGKLVLEYASIPPARLIDKRVSAEAFLFVSNWHSTLADLEAEMSDLRHRAMKTAGEISFASLTEFRRKLAYVHELAGPAHGDILEHLSRNEWFIKGKGKMSDVQCWSDKPVKSSRLPFHMNGPQPTDLRQVPDLMAEIENKIGSLIKAVNEEIQMAIGSVQVQDAKIMKQQTEDMKRQTEWTVALAVLAAIYLPMTLVTGIFGMNITEITDPETAPRRWSVVKAWRVTFGATIGSILVYVAVRRWWIAGLWRSDKQWMETKLERPAKTARVRMKTSVRNLVRAPWERSKRWMETKTRVRTMEADVEARSSGAEVTGDEISLRTINVPGDQRESNANREETGS